MIEVTSFLKNGLPVYDTNRCHIIITKPALTLLTLTCICIEVLKTTIRSEECQVLRPGNLVGVQRKFAFGET